MRLETCSCWDFRRVAASYLLAAVLLDSAETGLLPDPTGRVAA